MKSHANLPPGARRALLITGALIVLWILAAGRHADGGLMTIPRWIGEGEQKWELFGDEVAGGGDVNGDGYDDVLVGAYSRWAPGKPSTKQGRAYLFLGGPLGPSAEPDWIAAGEGDEAHFGRAVAIAGDVNGDGYDDLLIGSPNWGAVVPEVEGKVYLYLGSPTGPAPTPDWTARSFQTNGPGFGQSVAGLGDVNGDGYDDIAVTASGYDNGDGTTGRAMVWYGAAAGLGPDGTPANADWFAVGDVNGSIGSKVAGAGDVDGDGYDEILLGSAGYTDNRLQQSSEGWAFLFHGSNRGLNRGSDGTPGNADWTAQSNLYEGTWGWWVSGVGDVNGDGFDEVMVGGIYWENGQGGEGGAFLWLGGNNGLGKDGTADNADWWAEGDEGSARLGTVTHAGDLNGDGYADVVIGAGNAGGGTGRGRVTVWFGGPPGGGGGKSGLGPAPGVPSNADWAVMGEANGDALGDSVAGAGDTNGDGFPDIIAGARWADDAAGLAVGRAYIYLGTCGTQDADADGVAPAADPLCGVDDLTDCDDGVAGSWATPGEVRDLRWSDATTIAWDPPALPGGSAPRYDVLRADGAADFGVGDCVESDDALDTQATVTLDPAPGAVDCFLVRAENDCPLGEGTLGHDSDGVERSGRPCP